MKDYLDEFIKSDNIGLDYYYLSNIIKEENYENNYLLLYIEQLIVLKDYDKALFYLSNISKYYKDNIYIKTLINICSKDRLSNYNDFINRGVYELELYGKSLYEIISTCLNQYYCNKDTYYIYLCIKVINEKYKNYNTGIKIIDDYIDIESVYYRELLMYKLYFSLKINNAKKYNECLNNIFNLFSIYKIDNDKLESNIIEEKNIYNDTSIYKIIKKSLFSEKHKVKQV